MSREERIVVRCTAAEKKLLSKVAFAMQRTLSDAVRVLVLEKAHDLEIVVSHNVEAMHRGQHPKTKNGQHENQFWGSNYR